MGAQDDFDYALDFLATTQVSTPTMLWDPSFRSWQEFGIRINSQMMLVSPDLTETTGLFYGFNEAERADVLASLPALGRPA